MACIEYMLRKSTNFSTTGDELKFNTSQRKEKIDLRRNQMLIVCINKFGPWLPAVPAEECTSTLINGEHNYFEDARND